MSIENLYPYAGDHAVQNVIFVVEWAEPLKADAISKASKLATKFKNQGLAHVQHQQVFEFKIEQSLGNQVPPSSGSPISKEPGAVVFARSANTGEVTRSVTISRQHCMIAVPDYTRWDIVFTEIQAYLKIALDEIAPLRPLNAISLQYNDVFNWKDEPSNLNLKEVFAEDAFIPASVFEQKGLWHLHQGHMESQNLPVQHSRLENINVDMVDAAGERVIQIIGAHRAALREPLWQSHLRNEQVLLDIFSSLHIANKQMLRRLLTEQMCKKIMLTAS